MGVNNKSVISYSRSEIVHFIRLPLASIDKDPLESWHDNKSTMPQLYRMGRDYLAIPTEEAIFSSKMTFDDRCKLHSCTFKAEMCTWSWMEVLQESDVRISDNFYATSKELKINLDGLVGEDKVIDYILPDIHER